MAIMQLPILALKTATKAKVTLLLINHQCESSELSELFWKPQA